MARYFTLDQAQGLLPEVERMLRAAQQEKERFEEVETEWQTFQRRVQLLGGIQVKRDDVAALKRRREENLAALRDAITAITDLGVQVKDLDMGLVDFPTLYRGEEVLLCWRLGETGIEYWHDLNSGYRGRQSIDRDFLDHHHGDLAQ